MRELSSHTDGNHTTHRMSLLITTVRYEYHDEDRKIRTLIMNVFDKIALILNDTIHWINVVTIAIASAMSYIMNSYYKNLDDQQRKLQILLHWIFLLQKHNGLNVRKCRDTKRLEPVNDMIIPFIPLVGMSTPNDCSTTTFDPYFPRNSSLTWNWVERYVYLIINLNILFYNSVHSDYIHESAKGYTSVKHPFSQTWIIKTQAQIHPTIAKKEKLIVAKESWRTDVFSAVTKL